MLCPRSQDEWRKQQMRKVHTMSHTLKHNGSISSRNTVNTCTHTHTVVSRTATYNNKTKNEINNNKNSIRKTINRKGKKKRNETKNFNLVIRIQWHELMIERGFAMNFNWFFSVRFEKYDSFSECVCVCVCLPLSVEIKWNLTKCRFKAHTYANTHLRHCASNMLTHTVYTKHGSWNGG